MADRTGLEIIESITGLDEEGYSKAAVTLSVAFINKNDDISSQEGKNIQLQDTAIYMMKDMSGQFVTVSFSFGDCENPDLQDFWNFYQEFLNSGKVFMGSDETPVLLIDAMPINATGEDVNGTRVWVSMINPLCMVLTSNDNVNISDLTQPVQLDTIIAIYRSEDVFLSQEVIDPGSEI